jgi:hypothetical protein
MSVDVYHRSNAQIPLPIHPSRKTPCSTSLPQVDPPFWLPFEPCENRKKKITRNCPPLKKKKTPLVVHVSTFPCAFVCRSSQIAKFVTLQTFKILLFQENVDALFNVRNLGHESVLDLRDDFGNQLCVLHRLARLHDTHNSRLLVDMC